MKKLVTHILKFIFCIITWLVTGILSFSAVYRLYYNVNDNRLFSNVVDVMSMLFIPVWILLPFGILALWKKNKITHLTKFFVLTFLSICAILIVLSNIVR